MLKLTLAVFVLGCVTQSVFSQVWLNWQGREYLFITSPPLTYTQAETDCVQKGAVLASVVNSNESVYITSQISDFYWFGLYNTQTNLCSPDCSSCPATSTSGNCQNCYDCRRRWTWKDGKPMNWINWKAGQPNDGSRGGRCGKINGDGTWYDDECTKQMKYICKKDPTTTTQSTTTSTTTTTTTRPTTTTTTPTTTTTTPTTTTPTTTTTTPTTSTTTPTTTTTTPTSTTTTMPTTTTKLTTTSTASTTTTTATKNPPTTTMSPATTTTTMQSSGSTKTSVPVSTITPSTTTQKATIIVPVSPNRQVSFAAAVGIGVGVLVGLAILILILVICCSCCKRSDNHESKMHASEAGLHDIHNPTFEDQDYSNDSTLNKPGDRNSLDKNTLMYNSNEMDQRHGHENHAFAGLTDTTEDNNNQYTGLDTAEDNPHQYTDLENQDETDVSEVVEVENHPVTTSSDTYSENNDDTNDTNDEADEAEEEEEAHTDSTHDIYAQPDKKSKLTENSDTESGGNINGDENNHVDLNSSGYVPPAPPPPPLNM